jgi:exosortase/archaeosortase family protein
MHSVALSLKAKIAKLIPKTIVPLLKRTVVFLCLFVLISGIIGPHIISHGLVDKDGFQIYGGAGKALLFGAICLIILLLRNDNDMELDRWNIHNITWLVLTFLSGSVAWYGIDRLIHHSTNPAWPLLVNVCLISSVLFAAGASFGPNNLRRIYKKYRNEISLALLMTVMFYFFLLLIYGLWRDLASIDLRAVRVLLNLSGLKASRTLLLSKFGINIAEYCSGIESIALFTGLYVLIGVLDWKRFLHKRLFYLFPFALLILFGLNIFRVFILIVAGYYINPHIAFSLFHTYAGMIFFILYSAIFWAVTYKRLLKIN